LSDPATLPPPARRDIRRGQPWTPAQRLKNALIRGFVTSALSVVDRLPLPWVVALGRGLGRLACGLPSVKRPAKLALAEARALEAPPAVRTVCEHAGENLAWCLALRRGSFRALELVHVSDESRTLLARALDTGRGAVVMSAHLGPFEALAAAVAELGFAASLVVRESYDPRLDACVDAHRVGRGLEVIHRGKPRATFKIARALKRGRAVGILADLSGGVASWEVSLLGQRVLLPSGPVRLAHAARAPLLFAALLRRERSGAVPAFDLHLEPIAVGGRVAAHANYAAALERALGKASADWLWMADRNPLLPWNRRGA
jgi:KDO2-lipid IV(A) lauroyltransferase